MAERIAIPFSSAGAADAVLELAHCSLNRISRHFRFQATGGEQGGEGDENVNDLKSAEATDRRKRSS